MSDWKIDEEQLLELNAFLQRSDDVLLHNCVTRTAQESKLFPVLPYLDMSMIESYWRYPDQLRRSMEYITPEEVGHRARNASCVLSKLTSWGMLNYYLNGRSLLIRSGFIRPQDNLEDLWFMVNWWQRFARAYHRNSGHVYTLDAWDIAPDHEERVLQVFEADAYEADAELRGAVGRFTAIATQYNFLIHCESRSGLHSSGPYRMGGQKLMHVRDFYNLSESTLPWMDDVGSGVPYNNLSLVVITDGVRMEITDWATPYTTPENYQDQVIGVGLYTSDFLADRYIPVGMDSKKDLVDTLDQLTEQMKEATRALYRRFSGYSFDQMTEAGIVTYYQAGMDIMRMAGTYEQSEWDMIDARTRRLWDIYNEEYALDAYIDHFGTASGALGAQNEYYVNPVSYAVWRRAGGEGDVPAAGRTREFVPAWVIEEDDYPRRVNPNGLSDITGDRKIDAKVGKYVTTKGSLTQDEMNAAAREWSSPLLETPWRLIDEGTVKWWSDREDVDALYRYIQEDSRLISGKGSQLLRKDIDEIRRTNGERPWSDVTL